MRSHSADVTALRLFVATILIFGTFAVLARWSRFSGTNRWREVSVLFLGESLEELEAIELSLSSTHRMGNHQIWTRLACLRRVLHRSMPLIFEDDEE